jgi:hypothetical protein
VKIHKEHTFYYYEQEVAIPIFCIYACSHISWAEVIAPKPIPLDKKQVKP